MADRAQTCSSECWNVDCDKSFLRMGRGEREIMKRDNITKGRSGGYADGRTKGGSHDSLRVDQFEQVSSPICILKACTRSYHTTSFPVSFLSQ